MLISHAKKFIFIHNYKVAGTSVHKTLLDYTNITLRRTNKWDQFLIRIGYYPKLFSSQFDGHIYAKDLKKQLPAEIFNNYFKFGFVRNPWDWQVSLYSFMLKEGPSHPQYNIISKFKSFDEYIDWRVNNDINFQYEFFYDDDDNLLMDFIGKFEHINEDFSQVLKKTGISDMPLLHVNKSRDNSEFLHYYTPNSIKIVEQAFEKDIRLFNYKTPVL
jgi:Sulfotransferase family